MTAGAGPEDALTLPWRLMVLALVGELVPPEPARLGPLLRHARQNRVPAIPVSFSVRWHAPHAALAHLAQWADR